MSGQLEYINSDEVPEVPPLSHAVRYDNFVFVSGQVGLQIGESKPPESFTDEVVRAFTSLEQVLEASGATQKHIIKITCYLSDISDRDELNDVYLQLFPEPRPARTTVQVGLAHGLRFEVDAIAAIQDQAS
ncbi:RidA family protein [Yaniella flava]|uniref:RidA family protein n=1 Tax=Yaniella flava TaxID=287930 RepID=A0ABP5GKH0_9MICC